MYLLLSGKMKDSEGKFITLESGCPNCGYTGNMNSSSKIIGTKKVKVKVEKVIAKNYDRQGRLVGTTKGISEEEKVQRTVNTIDECPHCGNQVEKTSTYY